MTKGHTEIRQQAMDAGQGQVFQFWDTLGPEDQASLLASLKEFDFDLVNKFYRAAIATLNADQQNAQHTLQPLPSEICLDLTATAPAAQQPPPKELVDLESKLFHLGLEAIAANKVGALLLAGGQGTRLGFDHPKGMFNVGLPSNKTLFQIQAERILRLQELGTKYRKASLPNKTFSRPCTIFWYIMTSDATMSPTLSFFKDNKYFGLSASQILFFKQNALPCLTMDGKIMLQTKSKVAKAPDGNGGLYRALNTSGMLQHMRDNAIIHIHVYCVDNILVKVADPTFIGFCISKNANAGAKVVAKENPDEKVGVFCLVDGKYQTAEYTEIPKEASIQKTVCPASHKEKLVYDAGNIANHYFRFDFLELICRDHATSLPLHVAKKAIPTVDANGNAVTPKDINGMKMEMFIFDVFQHTSDFAVMYIDRATEFSPLKNALGAADATAAHCREDYIALCQHYLLKAGAKINPRLRLERKLSCEISPLVTYQGENLDLYIKDKVFNDNEDILLL